MSRYLTAALISFLLLSQGVFACGINIISQDQTPIDFKSTSGVVKTIMSIQEECTNVNGYVISISSLNGSKLKSNNASYSYQIKYGGEGPVSLGTAWQKTYLGPSSTDTKLLELIIPAYPLPVAGNYSDILTISVSSR